MSDPDQAPPEGRPDPSIRLHPEVAAGGYASDDGTVEFYQRVTAVCPKDAAVLDLGAGRGAVFEQERSEWKAFLLRLGGRCARRIGADVDPIVHENAELDEAHVISPGAPLPFADGSFDIVLCDWVIEHVDDPASFLREVRRVLKIGGWFCARTPNRWSYYAVAARLAPKSAESSALKRLQPGRHEQDVFPKFYRLNTLDDIAGQLRPEHWKNASYMHNPGPGYHGNRRWLYALLSGYQTVVPRALKTTILLFAQRLA